MEKKEFAAISLFSGAGGLDIGLSRAGWSILAQIEMDQDCVETLKSHTSGGKNTPKAINAKIEDVNPRHLRTSLKLKKGELGMLAGGPPCQPFTTHGLRNGINDARASSTFPNYIEYVSEFLPQSLLMENVDGLLSAALVHRPLSLRSKENAPLRWEEKKGSFLHWLISELTKLGYSISWGVAEAADYGAPQLRQRAILIGTRTMKPCFLPQPEFGPIAEKKFKTLMDGIQSIKDPGSIQPLSEFKRSVYQLIPAGGNWRDLPTKLQRRTMGAAFSASGGKGGWWRRLSWVSPSPTILGMPDHSSTGLIHPDEVRCLGVNECAAIQSFPKSIKFSGKPRSQYQQIGNAVPPLLGEKVARQIRNHLEGKNTGTPPEPLWRKESANRRIGTHGWARRINGEFDCTTIVKVREDHVWNEECINKNRQAQLSS